MIQLAKFDQEEFLKISCDIFESQINFVRIKFVFQNIDTIRFLDLFFNFSQILAERIDPFWDVLTGIDVEGVLDNGNERTQKEVEVF